MDPIYLDHAATTPVREEVRAAMAPFFEGRFGNPSSAHRWGREASASLEEARAACAEALGARTSEIHFVRGGTESDNLAVLGRAARLRADGLEPTVIVSALEHRAVLDAAAQATARGAGRLVVLGVDAMGNLDMAQLERTLAGGPALVSVMWVNNETGIELPLASVARLTTSAGATLHTDAVQAVGKVPVSVQDVPVDLLTVTGHKIYGPKGTGLLYTRRGTHVSPLLHGGGQERGLRAGTEDVAGAVGLAAALRLAVEEWMPEGPRLRTLRDELERRLVASLDGVRVNGGEAPRAPHVSSLAFAGVDGHTLVMALDLEGIAVSGGSACASGSTKPSHVVSALYGDDDTDATIRFSLGRSTARADIERAAEATEAIVRRLRGKTDPG